MILLAVEFVEVNGISRDRPFKIHFYDSLFRNSLISAPGNYLGESFCAQILPGAHAILLCYACDDPISLKNLHEWVRIVKKFRTPNTLLYLVGTKCDARLRFDENMYESVRASLGAVHGGFKTSSRTGVNVESLFAHVLNSFNKLPAILNQNEFKVNMLPSQRISVSERMDNLFSVSVITPKGTKKTPSNEITSLHEMISPSSDIAYKEGLKSNKLKVPDRDITIFSCRTVVKGVDMQPDMSYTEGRVILKNYTPQEVRATRYLDTCETSLAYGINSQSCFKPNVNSISRILNKKPVSKHLDEDFTELEDFEDEPNRIFSNCRYILEDESIILDEKSPKEKEKRKQELNIDKQLISEKDSQTNRARSIGNVLQSKDQSKKEKYVLNIWF